MALVDGGRVSRWRPRATCDFLPSIAHRNTFPVTNVELQQGPDPDRCDRRIFSAGADKWLQGFAVMEC